MKETKIRPRRRRAVRNPAGIAGIVTGGIYIGAGMWLGGMVNGFIPSFGSGMLMDAARGLASAYVVQMIASRFTGNAHLMAAGAFAPTAWSLLSGALGSARGLIGGGSSSIASGIAKSSAERGV